LLENLDILDDGYVIPRPAAESSVHDIFSTELVSLLTILTQTPSEFDAQKSKNRPPKPKMESTQVEILQRALRTKATFYPTSIAEDEQILAQLPYVAEDASSRRKRMALQVRLGEKETLSAALSVLEHHLAQVPEHRKRSASNGGETRQAKMPRV
jgi:SET domain-containing protein 6